MHPSSILFLCLILIAAFGGKILSVSVKYDPVPEGTPIIYPKEPMGDNFNTVLFLIENISCKKELNNAFMHKEIFKGNYRKEPNNEMLCEALDSAYKEKETSVKGRM